MYDIRSGYLRDVAIHSTGSSRKNDGVAGCREDRSWMSATVSSAVNLPECIFLPVVSGGMEQHETEPRQRDTILRTDPIVIIKREKNRIR